MLSLTYRTLGTWGPGKGANLQASEVDNNFWALAQEINSLINDPTQPNGIAGISVSGTQMYITLNDGTVLGPYTLPVLTFRWRGEWTASTPYAQLDVFTVSGSGIFFVQAASYLSGTAFDSTDPALVQLFGDADAHLSGLPDVRVTNLADGDALVWVATDQKWENFNLGDMAYQDSSLVNITGGMITGLPDPQNALDAANKEYVDAAVVGGTPAIPPMTMICNVNTTISAAAGPALLSDFLDAAFGTTVAGNIIYRAGGGWTVLPPGAAGSILQSNGAGLPVAWTTSPGAGVVSITAGSGISTGGAPITSTGTISLANVSDGNLLADITGSSQPPTGVTLSAFLDHVLGSTRGSLLTRQASGWLALSPGTTGYYLMTQGSGADAVWSSPAGTGTVQSVGSGTGLTGGPITGTGTLSLAAIPDSDVLANISGASAAPVPTTLSLLWDHVFGSAQGNILYRGASAWLALAPGTTGQILTTGGAGAVPSWQNAPTSGGNIANGQILSNITGHTAVPSGNTLSAIFDAILSSSQGSVIYRTNSGWVALAPGTAGQVLTTQGGTANPAWTTNGGANLNIVSPAAQDTLSYNSTSGKFENVRPRYHLGSYVPGTMVANQNLLFHRFSKGVTIPANFGAYLGHISEAAGGSAATASTVIQLSKALAATPTTWTNIATITFAGGQVLGTFSTQAAITFAQGDLIRLRGPATADVSFSDFTVTIMGYET